MVQLDLSSNLFFADKDLNDNKLAVETAYSKLLGRSGKGNDFLGWIDLPEQVGEESLKCIETCAERLRKSSEVVVVVGIGGSYLGARAVIEALQNSYANFRSHAKTDNCPVVVYAGNHMAADVVTELFDYLKDKDYSVVVISKSGTTTEPAIAFRMLKGDLEQRYGKSETQHRIVAITDEHRGALKKLADTEGYETYVIPDDVGGRYSVLSPVGLLPIAVAGVDIRALLNGAKSMRQQLMNHQDFSENIAQQYALMRYLLYQKGKKIELMVSYTPKLNFFIEWYKQLFGESEGKEGKGVFPAGAVFSTDLHSLGQYIQQGERHIFETVISIKNSNSRVLIPMDDENLDGLNYLKDKTLHDVNLTAEEGTRQAHVDGCVPNLKIAIDQLDENHLGQLIYFFEMSCAIGGYLLDINPFDQPGVEAYKKNMFALLGKPM